MIRGLPRGLRWLIYLLLPLLIIYFTLNVLLTSTAFSRFVLNQVEARVPELQFSQVHGNFMRGLHLDFRYESEELDLQATGAQLQLGLDCLWQLKLCIRQLHAEDLRLVLQGSADEEREPEPDSTIDLPDIDLPVEARLESLTVGRLQVFRGQNLLYQLSELDSALSWRGNQLRVERLASSDDWCHWAAEAQINFIDHYPLQLDLSCQSVQELGDFRAELGGDLAQLLLRLEAELSAPFIQDSAVARASISLALLDKDMPLSARLELEPAAFNLSDEILLLDSGELTLEGPLLSPEIRAALNFESPYWSGSSLLTLNARADTEALQLRSLLLQLPEGQLNVAGRLDYSEGLSWRGEAEWEDVQLEQFVEGLAGRLHGQILSQLDYVDERLSAELSLRSVRGSILERSFAARGELAYADEVLQVNELDLRQGDNRIQLNGDLSLAQASNIRLNINLPQLRQLIPEQWLADFEGALQGEIHLAGTREQPTIEGRLLAQNIRYDTIALEQGELNLDWQGADEAAVNFRLHLSELGFGEDMAATLTLSGQGSQSVHSLAVNARGLGQHQDKQLRLQCRGGFAGSLTDPWRGQCGRLDLDFQLTQAHQWRLQKPLQLVVDPQTPELELSAFCLVYQEASLCSTGPILYRSDQLSPVTVTGSNFAAEWFQDLLPVEEVQLGGRWALHFSAAELLAEQPKMNASLSSSDLALAWTGSAEPLNLKVEDLNLRWTLEQQRHYLVWELDTETSGAMQGELSLADTRLGGRLNISGVELADYGHLFLPEPEDEVAGVLNAELALGGTIENPSLNGQLRLAGGKFRSNAVPLPVDDINLLLSIRGNTAGIDGEFRAAEGQGHLGGEFQWQGLDWSGYMSVTADPVLVQPEPSMRVHVAPDLRFDFAPQRIAISGRVAIPQAELEVSELPAQAVSVSSDTVIVGAETDAGPALEVLTNIELQLGDRVSFEGFGLETNITGNLRLQQRSGEMMRANGRLSLVEGRYEAYAQNLVIRSGDLVFVGDIDNPQLRLEAVRGDTPENITVGLRVSGPARNPRVTLFSQPDMPQQAQLSYLITGSAPGASSEIDPQAAAAEAALSYALESGIGTGITRRAGDALGIEDLQVTAGSTDAGTQIGLSGYITPRLLVRYGVGVFDAINTWTLRYQLSRNVYLEAISGEASDVGVMWSFERD